jgi:hypothetical protein
VLLLLHLNHLLLLLHNHHHHLLLYLQVLTRVELLPLLIDDGSLFKLTRSRNSGDTLTSAFTSCE